jgi:hypothetical protein
MHERWVYGHTETAFHGKLSNTSHPLIVLRSILVRRILNGYMPGLRKQGLGIRHVSRASSPDQMHELRKPLVGPKLVQRTKRSKLGVLSWHEED